MSIFYQVLNVLRNLYRTIVICLSLQLFSRSLDYFTGSMREESPLLIVIDLESPTIWGGLGLSICAILFVGMILRKPPAISVGAVLGSILYTTFAWMQLVVILDQGAPYDDWRTMTAYMSGAVLWGAIAIIGVLIPSFDRVKKEYDGVSSEPHF